MEARKRRSRRPPPAKNPGPGVQPPAWLATPSLRTVAHPATHVAPKRPSVGARSVVVHLQNRRAHESQGACSSSTGAVARLRDCRAMFDVDRSPALAKLQLLCLESAALGAVGARWPRGSEVSPPAATRILAVGVPRARDADRVGLSECARYRRALRGDTARRGADPRLLKRARFGADIRIIEVSRLRCYLRRWDIRKVKLVDANGRSTDLVQPQDDQDGHAWFTLQMGGHFDLAGRR